MSICTFSRKKTVQSNQMMRMHGHGSATGNRKVVVKDTPYIGYWNELRQLTPP